MFKTRRVLERIWRAIVWFLRKILAEPDDEEGRR